MGIVWLVIMWLAWGLWALFEKIGADRIGIAATFLVSCLIAIPVEIYYISQIKQLPPIKDMLFPRLASICGLLGSIAYLHACKYFKGSVVVAIQALYPLCTVLLLVFIYKEQLTTQQIIGIALATIAIFLIV
jgi:uncharacterized membrane protein